VVVGRLVDAGFEVAVAQADGAGVVVHRDTVPGALADASSDGAFALVAFAPDGDWLHLGIRVVRLSDGEVVSELVRAGSNLEPVGFHPGDSSQVLFSHEPDDRLVPAIWDTVTGVVSDVRSGLSGDVSAAWDASGDVLLLTALEDARHRLFRFDRGSGGLEPVELPAGSVSASSPRPDGSVHALVSRADLPATLLRWEAGATVDLVRLPGDPPPPSVAVQDVHVAGVGGTIHALVHRPPDGTPPYPTLFAVHGGPTGQDLDAWNDTVAAFVDAGYAVVRVNYRGSTGYGAAWRDALHRRLGFIELEDVTAVRARLVADGLVDPDRVGIVGGSWGGFLTLMALGTQPDQWVTGVALVPLADWFTNAEDAPSFMKAYDASIMGGTIEEIPEAYRASSPITYADAVRAPLLVSAGENDPRCPVRQVDSYVERLRARDHPVEYVRLATGHALPDLDMKVSEMQRVLAFLARTLPTDRPGQERG
jgi:dipeptidyl aminopeptidase/acylaminoacyl peptidase